MSELSEDIEQIINNLLSGFKIKSSQREDFFQDLYLYYLQIERRHNADSGVPYKAFIIVFLTYRLKTLLRNSIRNSFQELPEDRSSKDDLSSLENQEYLSSILKELNQEELALLILRYIDELSLEEIALKTGFSLGGIHKKLKKLEDKIRWQEKQEEPKRNESKL